MSSSAELHTLYQVANAPLHTYPFPHLLVHEVFEPEHYRRMLAHLLPERLMRPIKEVRALSANYSDARFVFPLSPDALATLPEPYGSFWSEVTEWLLAMPLLDCLLDRFAPYLAQRFGGRTPALYNEAMLVDDRSGYALGPHSDKPTKVITLLFYLPVDATRPHLGTAIYVPRNRSFRCPGGPHYDFALFERVRTMPYVPNTLFAFFKTDQSFHGVEPVRERDVRRQLLFYDVYCEPESLSRGTTSATGGRPEVEFMF